jgi:hypothetical protein
LANKATLSALANQDQSISFTVEYACLFVTHACGHARASRSAAAALAAAAPAISRQYAHPPLPAALNAFFFPSLLPQENWHSMHNHNQPQYLHKYTTQEISECSWSHGQADAYNSRGVMWHQRHRYDMKGMIGSCCKRLPAPPSIA